MKTLVKNGTIILASGEFKADILIDGETISVIGKNLNEPCDRIIDAEGKYVIPGGVDNHAHYAALNTDGVTRSAGYEISWCALTGGTTTIVDFCANEPGMTMCESFDYRMKHLIPGKLAPDLAYHANCTNFTENSVSEIRDLIALGIPSMKVFMAYKGTALYVDDRKLLAFLKEAKKYGMTMMVHAENSDVLDMCRDEMAEAGNLSPQYHYMTRPPYGEAEAVSRAICFADAMKCPICIVHVSCIEAGEVIRQAKADSKAVIGETCPHYLALDKHLMDNPDFNQACRWVCSPPLRDQKDRDYLWKALNHGWLTVCGSDNSAIPLSQKYDGKKDFRKIPNGCPGSGDRLPAMWTFGVAAGKISKEKFVEINCTAPAKLNGLYPRKGTIEVGSDADIVIWDPDYRGTFSLATNPTGIDYNIFEGMEQIGRAETVLLRGKVVVENNQYIGTPGEGKFIPGKPFGLAYSLLK